MAITVEEKNLHISGPVQFKPMLFKGQLYLKKAVQLSSDHLSAINSFVHASTYVPGSTQR